MDSLPDVIREPIEEALIKVKSWEWRDGIQQILNLTTIVFSALMIWKGLMLFTGSESPVVVVLSGSMEPTMYRGDILALYMPDEFEIGDIVVFSIKERDIPIIHRVIQTHKEYVYIDFDYPCTKSEIHSYILLLLLSSLLCCF